MDRIVLFSLISLSVILSACTKYNECEPAFDEYRCFEATFESVTCDEETRTYLDANIKLLWHADDEVSIFTTTLNEKYSFNG